MIDPSEFDEVKPWAVMPDNSQDFPESYRQPKWRVGPGDPHGYHDAFQKMMYQKRPNTGDLRPEYLLPRLIFECLSHTQDLKALADSRHILRITPPEWRAIERLSQGRMKTFLTNTLRTVHLKSQYYLPLASPMFRVRRQAWMSLISDFGYLTTMAQCEYVRKLENAQQRRLQRGQGTITFPAAWISAFDQSLHDAYESMLAAWNWAQANGQNPAAAFGRALADMPEMTRLVMILLERETSFDNLLAQEHIFGCLYDKRIHLLSSLGLTYLWNSVYVTAAEPDQMLRDCGIYQHLNPLYNELHSCQERLNKLFDYRTNMKWSWNRMWDRLYVIINPQMNISDTTIDKFTRAASIDFNTGHTFFGVQPITRQQMQDEQCPICLNRFIDGAHRLGVVVMKTKCGHYFHPKCIFLHWDRPNYWQNQCPICRQPAGRLRDALGDVKCAGREEPEFEVPNTEALADIRRALVAAKVNQRQQIPYAWSDEVLNAYWDDWVMEHILKPMRADREAGRPSWETVLGE